MQLRPVHEARLSRNEFLDLEFAITPVPFDDRKHNWVLGKLAERINTDHAGDFTNLSQINPFFLECVDIAENYSERKFGIVTLTVRGLRDNYLLISYGHHRCIAYASLVLTGKRYNPIRAIILKNNKWRRE